MTSMIEPVEPKDGPLQSESNEEARDGYDWNGPATFWIALTLVITMAILVGVLFG